MKAGKKKRKEHGPKKGKKIHRPEIKWGRRGKGMPLTIKKKKGIAPRKKKTSKKHRALAFHSGRWRHPHSQGDATPNNDDFGERERTCRFLESRNHTDKRENTFMLKAES